MISNSQSAKPANICTSRVDLDFFLFQVVRLDLANHELEPLAQLYEHSLQSKVEFRLRQNYDNDKSALGKRRN